LYYCTCRCLFLNHLDNGIIHISKLDNGFIRSKRGSDLATHLANLSCTRRTNNVLHLHGFHNAQLLSYFDMVSLLIDKTVRSAGCDTVHDDTFLFLLTSTDTLMRAPGIGLSTMELVSTISGTCMYLDSSYSRRL
jgi:hypothetical protein